MGKDLERDHDKAGTDGAAFASAKAKVHRHASEINEVREQSKGGEADLKDAIDMVKDVEGRDQRAEDDFDRRILGYGGTRSYYWLHPSSMEAEDDGRGAATLDKR